MNGHPGEEAALREAHTFQTDRAYQICTARRKGPGNGVRGVRVESDTLAELPEVDKLRKVISRGVLKGAVGDP